MKLETLHGTAVRIGPCGVLIRGRPGAGKSSLALALIDDRGYGVGQKLLSTRLVADDQVELWRNPKGALVMQPPPSLAGKLEIRGLGIVDVGYVRRARLHLVADLSPDGPPERFPDEASQTIQLQDVELARLHLWSADPRAHIRLRAAVSLHVASQSFAA